MGSPSAPKAPPPPSPPPTETSADVTQEQRTMKKRAAGATGYLSTILSQRTNPAAGGGKTLLGE